MPATIDQSATSFTVRLDGDAGIIMALELKGMLTEVLASRQEFKVALEGVTAVDVTTLQLLWASERAAEKAGVKLLFSGPIPEEMELAIGLAGMDRLAVDPK